MGGVGGGVNGKVVLDMIVRIVMNSEGFFTR